MNDITELERRISAALARIAEGLEQVPLPASQLIPVTGPGSLAEELESERLVNAQLAERVRVIREKQETMVGSLEGRLAKSVEQADRLGIEVQRMKASNIALRENNRVLREALEAGAGDAHLINKSMVAELDALRASRLTEMAELDDVMAELRPLIEDRTHA